jgi:hypothetical protein
VANTKQQIKKELAALVEEGANLYNTEVDSKHTTRSKTTRGSQTSKDANEQQPIQQTYQSWYTRALPVIRQLLPERYAEFQELYKNDKRKEITFRTYTISDYLLNLRITRGGEEVNSLAAFATKFHEQLAILMSALDRLNSLLADIRTVLQAEFFDDEIAVARELLKKGHLRAAGAVAGVTLERHLGTVASAHGVTMRKADPSISDWNDVLKKDGILDVPDWRFIQRLGDIRNLCAHSKDREPTKDEVDELIQGTEKLVKTLA